METESHLADEDFQALYAVLWEKPTDAIAAEVLDRLSARRYIRRDGDGWSVTYLGHVQFLTRRAKSI